MNIGTVYRRIRSGKAFLIGLLIFAVCWVGLHYATGFDQDLGLYNTILSTEASVNGTLIVIFGEQQAKNQTRQLKYMLDLMEVIHQHVIKNAVDEKQKQI